ncbi:MAG: dipeptidase [Lachnospiraceae bacterium]|nr:dipeptidase [Lachnospiraceae bacterium]
MRPYIDMHCDTLLHRAKSESEIDLYELPQAMVDVKRLRECGVLAQFFAIFMPADGDELLNGFQSDQQYFDILYDSFIHTLKEHPDEIRLAGSNQELEENRQNGVLSAILTVEDARILQENPLAFGNSKTDAVGSLKRLREFYDKGVRLMTLTWNFENCIGFPNSPSTELTKRGLKPFGKEAVIEMNRLGMIIDVSHLSDGGFYDVAQISTKPFVASHSNCRALSPHPRNLTDDMIRILAEHGGVAGLNLEGEFLNQDITDSYSSISSMVKHVQHMLQTGGEDILAIGTDFDGIEGTFEVGEPKELNLLFEQLLKNGITPRQLDKMLTGNVRRVLHEVWK